MTSPVLAQGAVQKIFSWWDRILRPKITLKRCIWRSYLFRPAQVLSIKFEVQYWPREWPGKNFSVDSNSTLYTWPIWKLLVSWQYWIYFRMWIALNPSFFAHACYSPYFSSKALQDPKHCKSPKSHMISTWFLF